MSSSELIGSHVYSPQQLSTAGQQYGPRHQLQTKQAHTCTGPPCFRRHRDIWQNGESAAVEPGKADGRQETGIKVSRDDPSEGYEDSELQEQS